MKRNCSITPIQKAKESFNNNSIYIKRDDLFPISFGGNKARKALLFFQDLDRNKCNCVVTYGSSSSNHCRIIANIAASKNMPCFIISPIENSKSTYNSLLMELFGAEIIFCRISDVKKTIDQTIKKLISDGEKPYFIQGGGHGNLGTKAYVEVYEEIKQYEYENDIYFDYIFLSSGTGTTQAGLICGCIINDDEREIIGISNARLNPYGGNVVFESVNSYLTSIGKSNIGSEKVSFVDDYVLDGYGSYNMAILQTLRDVLIHNGIPLDTTYTAKAYWGMTELIEKQKISNKNILFIHTGGLPLFFDSMEVIVNE